MTSALAAPPPTLLTHRRTPSVELMYPLHVCNGCAAGAAAAGGRTAANAVAGASGGTPSTAVMQPRAPSRRFALEDSAEWVIGSQGRCLDRPVPRSPFISYVQFPACGLPMAWVRGQLTFTGRLVLQRRTRR